MGCARMSKVDVAQNMRHSFGARAKCVFVVIYNVKGYETHFIRSFL